MALIIDGVIGWDTTGRSVRHYLAAREGQAITVEITSPGGSVAEGLEIFNRLNNHEGRVTAIIMGEAASMATYIALAADVVEVECNAVFMIHNPWTFAYGDYVEFGKTTAHLESLAALLAQVYTQRTGKPEAEIRELMDAETYFYGQEIKTAGFADLVRGEVDADADVDLRITAVKASVQACYAKLKQADVAEDFDKIAAMLQDGVQGRDSAPDTNPAEAEKKEASIMTLAELMAKNPELQAEVDAVKATAQQAGFEAGKEAVEARIKATAPYLGNSEYPAAVGNLALDVLNGKKDQAALDGAVTVLDAQAEQKKTDDAGDEQPGETPAAGAGDVVTENGMIESEDDFNAEISRAKGGK